MCIFRAKKWCSEIHVFDWFDSVLANNFSVGIGFLGWTSTKQGLKCLAQGHDAVKPVRLQPKTLRSWDKHSTTEPLHPGGGGGYSYICTHSWPRSFLGVHNFDFIIFGFFQKNKYFLGIFWGSKFWISLFLGVFRKTKFFGGMEILWIFFGVTTKLDYIVYLGVISMHFMVFS